MLIPQALQMLLLLMCRSCMLVILSTCSPGWLFQFAFSLEVREVPPHQRCTTGTLDAAVVATSVAASLCFPRLGILLQQEGVFLEAFSSHFQFPQLPHIIHPTLFLVSYMLMWCSLARKTNHANKEVRISQQQCLLGLLPRPCRPCFSSRTWS